MKKFVIIEIGPQELNRTTAIVVEAETAFEAWRQVSPDVVKDIEEVVADDEEGELSITDDRLTFEQDELVLIIHAIK